MERERAAVLRARGIIPARGRVLPDEGARRGGEPRLIVQTGAGNACSFFDAAGGGLCAIHRDAGPELMPDACRNFPRVALRDPRGTFITLSHACPTAARLLLTAGEIRRVDAPAGVSLGGAVQGLDASMVLPPLLRPGMLMDLDGYTAWEAHALSVLNAPRYSAAGAVRAIRATTEWARGWHPGQGPLVSRVADAFKRAPPADLRNDAPPGSLEHATKAFLAAHLFGSWAAYQGCGLMAVVDALDSALAVLGTGVKDSESFVAAAGAADMHLRHRADHVDTRPLPALRHG